jgi:hypothetical protein
MGMRSKLAAIAFSISMGNEFNFGKVILWIILLKNLNLTELLPI